MSIDFNANLQLAQWNTDSSAFMAALPAGTYIQSKAPPVLEPQISPDLRPELKGDAWDGAVCGSRQGLCVPFPPQMDTDIRRYGRCLSELPNTDRELIPDLRMVRKIAEALGANVEIRQTPVEQPQTEG